MQLQRQNQIWLPDLNDYPDHARCTCQGTGKNIKCSHGSVQKLAEQLSSELDDLSSTAFSDAFTCTSVESC